MNSNDGFTTIDGLRISNSRVLEIAQNRMKSHIAFTIWGERGRPRGGDGKADWFESERRLRARTSTMISGRDVRLAYLEVAAYLNWTKKGKPEGDDGRINWLEAERGVPDAYGAKWKNAIPKVA